MSFNNYFINASTILTPQRTRGKIPLTLSTENFMIDAVSKEKEQLKEIVKQFKNKSSSCIDGVSCQIIKYSMDEIIEALTLYYY